MSKRNKQPTEQKAEDSRPAEAEKKPFPQKPTEWERELEEAAPRSR
jgi:hypothetical protein